ncbi:MAG: hypothetical protein FWD63_08505 [Propionibacteriaceae bacterium]|nr:hypothetical protein [Propionibacteriaceae bacterium]
MIIFSGWGILALLPPGAGAGLGVLIGNSVSSSTNLIMLFAAIGLMIGSAGDWYLGIWLNKTRPAAELDQALAARQQTLQQLVASGQYYRGPGFPMPTSMQDAQNQAQAQFAAESAAAHARVGNRNTLFFVPIQYWAYVGAGIGAVMAVASFFIT